MNPGGDEGLPDAVPPPNNNQNAGVSDGITDSFDDGDPGALTTDTAGTGAPSGQSALDQLNDLSRLDNLYFNDSFIQNTLTDPAGRPITVNPSFQSSWNSNLFEQMTIGTLDRLDNLFFNDTFIQNTLDPSGTFRPNTSFTNNGISISPSFQSLFNQQLYMPPPLIAPATFGSAPPAQTPFGQASMLPTQQLSAAWQAIQTQAANAAAAIQARWDQMLAAISQQPAPSAATGFDQGLADGAPIPQDVPNNTADQLNNLLNPPPDGIIVDTTPPPSAQAPGPNVGDNPQNRGVVAEIFSQFGMGNLVSGDTLPAGTPFSVGISEVNTGYLVTAYLPADYLPAGWAAENGAYGPFQMSASAGTNVVDVGADAFANQVAGPGGRALDLEAAQQRTEALRQQMLNDPNPNNYSQNYDAYRDALRDQLQQQRLLQNPDGPGSISDYLQRLPFTPTENVLGTPPDVTAPDPDGPMYQFTGNEPPMGLGGPDDLPRLDAILDENLNANVETMEAIAARGNEAEIRVPIEDVRALETNLNTSERTWFQRNVTDVMAQGYENIQGWTRDYIVSPLTPAANAVAGGLQTAWDNTFGGIGDAFSGVLGSDAPPPTSDISGGLGQPGPAFSGTVGFDPQDGMSLSPGNESVTSGNLQPVLRDHIETNFSTADEFSRIHGIVNDKGQLWGFEPPDGLIVPIDSPEGQRMAGVMGCTGTCYSDAVTEARNATTQAGSSAADTGAGSFGPASTAADQRLQAFVDSGLSMSGIAENSMQLATQAQALAGVAADLQTPLTDAEGAAGRLAAAERAYANSNLFTAASAGNAYLERATEFRDSLDAIVDRADDALANPNLTPEARRQLQSMTDRLAGNIDRLSTAIATQDASGTGTIRGELTRLSSQMQGFINTYISGGPDTSSIGGSPQLSSDFVSEYNRLAGDSPFRQMPVSDVPSSGQPPPTGGQPPPRQQDPPPIVTRDGPVPSPSQGGLFSGSGNTNWLSGLGQLLRGLALYNALNQQQPQLPQQPILPPQPPIVISPPPPNASTTPIQLPSVALVANPNSVPVNGTSTLVWTSLRSNECVVRYQNGSVLASGGAQGTATTPTLSQTVSFVLTCGNNNGTRSATTAVYVGEKPPASAPSQTSQPAPTINVTTGTGGATSGTGATSSNSSNWCDPSRPTDVFIACLQALPGSANPIR